MNRDADYAEMILINAWSVTSIADQLGCCRPVIVTDGMNVLYQMEVLRRACSDCEENGGETEGNGTVQD